MNGLPDISEALKFDLLLKLLLAVLLGGAIGFERERRGKPAGLRTNILICIGAVLFTYLSQRIASDHGDPGRLAAQILTGVGFIGAGTILHTRGSVTGLTSAATIWVVTAIGVALGAGAYVEAGGTTILVMVVLGGLVRFEAFLAHQASPHHLIIHAKPSPTTFPEIEALIQRAGVQIVKSEYRLENVDLVIEFDVAGPRRLFDQALIAIVHHPTVRTVSPGE